MLQQIMNAVRIFVVLTVICGLLYPLLMTGLAQALFPFQANGSIITRNNAPVGSKLIGQNFANAGYFHGRPSAAGEKGYDATSSGGSNLGPTSKKLLDTVSDNLKQIREGNGLNESAQIPSDLVLASGSGLDPDISPPAAYLQVERIARERKLEPGEVLQLVEKYTQGRQWMLLGELRVNVLELNLALDAIKH
jgi:K+-transporting ATPase ATPase C chain